MKKNYLLCIFLCLPLHAIDIFIKDLDRKTKVLKREVTFNLKESGEYIPRLRLEDDNKKEIPIESVDYDGITPMLKIVGSNIVLDGNNYSIKNNIEYKKNIFYHGGVIGLEIGYSPAELAANSSLKQSKNVVIKNLILNNFDCSILIHQGVSGVTIENCQFINNPLGLLSLGQNGPSHTNDIFNMVFKDIVITGFSGHDVQPALVKIKNRIENNYGYTADLFMPLRQDPLNSNSQDVYTYMGMCLIYSDNVSCRNITINDIGYADYDQLTEGDGYRTEGIGCIVKNSRRVFIDDITCNDCRSEIKCVGMQLENVVRMRVTNGIFSHNKSNVKTVGIEVINDAELDYSIDEVRFESVSCEANTGGEFVAGMDLSSSRGFAGYGLVCKFNQAGKEAYGIYTNKAQAMLLRDDTTLTTNYATRTINDVETEQGIVAAGFYGINVMGLQVEQVTCIGMQALNSAYGMYLKDGINFRVSDSQFSANVSSMRRGGEEAQIRADQDASEISKFAPAVSSTNSGSYGFFCENCKKMMINRCYTVSNYGHRTAGFCFKDCTTIGLSDSLISAQTAIGTMLDQSFYDDHVANPHVYNIQNAHKALLFSDLTKTKVDLIITTNLFLDKMSAIRGRQVLNLEPLYDDVITMLASANLLQASIARYRMWGTAFGIHAHNSIGCLFKNNTCAEQISLYDNAASICFSGRCAGQLIEDSNLSYNQAGYISAQAFASSSASFAYQYDLSLMKLFWEALAKPWNNYHTIDVGSAVYSVSLSPDTTKLAVGDASNSITIFNTTDWAIEKILTNHTAPITSLAWKSDGSMLASGSEATTNNILIFDTSDWSVAQTITHGTSGIAALSWSPDGSNFLSGSSDTLDNGAVWDTSLWTVEQFLTHGTGITSVAWRHDGNRLATASSESSDNIKIWSKGTTWEEEYSLSDHTDAVNSIAWSSDDMLFVSTSSDMTTKVWDPVTWAVTKTYTGQTNVVNDACLAHNQARITTVSSDGVARVFDVENAELLQTLMGHTGSINKTIALDEASIITAGSDGLLKFWHLDSYTLASDQNTPGIYTDGGAFIAQGQKDFGNGSSGDDISITIDGINTYPLVSPIGPFGAGLIIGDYMMDAYVKNNQIHFNIGNAGHGYGVVFDQSYYSVLENNVIEGTVGSIYGFAAGVLDVTAHCSNTYMKNFFESNKVSSYTNANYMIPFNPSDSNSLTFPVTKMYNGNFIQPTTDFDNIVMEYSQSNEAYSVESLVNLPVHPDLKAKLTDNNCWQ